MRDAFAIIRTDMNRIEQIGFSDPSHAVTATVGPVSHGATEARSAAWQRFNGTRCLKVCLWGALLLAAYSCFHGQSRLSPSRIIIGNVLNSEPSLTQRYERLLIANRADNAFLCRTNENVIWRYQDRGGTVSVMGVDFVGERRGRNLLEVPPAIDGARVTEIGVGAFLNRKDLVEILLPDSIETIGDFAFAGCTMLNVFQIPPKVEKIGDCLFVGCSDMTTVRISEKASSVGTFAFLGCESLRNFEVDSNNRSLMSRDGVLLTRDGSELICYPSGREKKRYAIPSTVKVVRKGAFVDCAHLVSVSVPEEVEVVDDWNFFACRRLKAVFMNTDGRAKLGRNVPLKVLRNAH